MKAVNNAKKEEESSSPAFYVFTGLMVLGFAVLIGAVVYMYFA